MWLSENLIHQDSNFELNELKEDPPQYELKKNEQPIPAVMPDDVAVLKKAVELLQIEMWKLKGEVEEMKKKEKK